MKIVAETNVKHGNRVDKPQYDVTVSEYGGKARVTFAYHGNPAWPKGGFLVLPASVADRLGQALQVAASGPLKTDVSFEIDETKIV